MSLAEVQQHPDLAKPPKGLVDFTIESEACLVLVKVQVTASPALIGTETAVSPACQLVCVLLVAVSEAP